VRVDLEDLETFMQLDHKTFDKLTKGNFENQLTYYEQINYDERWMLKTSPYYIFEILNARNSGVYEIWYDYIKRHIDRKSTIYDFGAGIGTLETMLIKRYPISICIYESNLLCLDFINWRLVRRGYNRELNIRRKHYDYVISLDTIQRLPDDQMKPALRRLLISGDRCFIYINHDSRHPMHNEIPFDVKKYIERHALSVDDYHGLLDIRMVEYED